MSHALPMSHTLSLPSRPEGRAKAALSASPVASSVSSTDILRGQKAVEINHNGLTYRLQATRLGKLILTK